MKVTTDIKSSKYMRTYKFIRIHTHTDEMLAFSNSEHEVTTDIKSSKYMRIYKFIRIHTHTDEMLAFSNSEDDENNRPKKYKRRKKSDPVTWYENLEVEMRV